ncbi:MAG: hypothetical protein Rhirs2KO_20120 [Rhizobiaceae bacterium]
MERLALGPKKVGGRLETEAVAKIGGHERTGEAHNVLPARRLFVLAGCDDEDPPGQKCVMGRTKAGDGILTERSRSDGSGVRPTLGQG